jgi:hypothetical protein
MRAGLTTAMLDVDEFDDHEKVFRGSYRTVYTFDLSSCRV